MTCSMISWPSMESPFGSGLGRTGVASGRLLPTVTGLNTQQGHGARCGIPGPFGSTATRPNVRILRCAGRQAVGMAL